MIRFENRLRIYIDDQAFLGPGRVMLLENIERQGSISQAAQMMDMSYRKAWTLVKEMNTLWHTPLVMKQSGGKAGGQAALTEAGRGLANQYRQMERSANEAIAISSERLNALK